MGSVLPINRPKPLHWLTAFRYFAAVWVVLLHSLNATTKLRPHDAIEGAFRVFVERGFLGVSFFFMLSGFILTWNYPVIRSKWDYAVARAGRILPVYYLSLLFALPLVVMGVFREGGEPLLIAVKGILTVTLTQAWIPTVASFWNGPAWTLSCEAFFYTSLVFLLPIAVRHFQVQKVRRLFVCLAVFWVAGLILPTLFQCFFPDSQQRMLLFSPETSQMAMQQKAQHFIERFPLLRIVEFLSGMVLCLGAGNLVKDISALKAGVLLGVGIAWVAASMFFPYIFSIGTLCLPGFACIIIGAAALPVPEDSRVFKWLVLLGNASYAVYLFHNSIRDYIVIACRKGNVLVQLSGGWFFFFFFLIVLVLSTALSLAIYCYYEEPMRRWVKQLLAKQSFFGLTTVLSQHFSKIWKSNTPSAQ